MFYSFLDHYSKLSFVSCFMVGALIGCHAKEEGAGIPTSRQSLESQKSDANEPIERNVNEAIHISREKALAEVHDHLEAGRTEQAIELLYQLLVLNPKDAEVLFYLANVNAEKGKLQEAIDLLSEISPDEPEAGVAALGVAAEWCFELEQFVEVERRYLKILELEPSANMARRPLAYLYNRQGRRHEAVKLIRELCRSGDVTQDELHALIVEADAMYDPPGSQPAPGERAYWPIGPMGRARLEFTEHRYAEAAIQVEPMVRSGEAPPSVVAFYGLAVAESQDDEKFDWWLKQVDERARAYPEYWAAIGTRLMADARFEEGLRALAEAIAGDPTDIRSTRRVVQAFRAMNNQPLVDQWVQRYQLLADSVALGGDIADGRIERIVSLAEKLETLSRKLEAILWLGIFSVRQNVDDDVMRQLNAERLATLEKKQAFPTKEDIFDGWEVDARPLPDLLPGRSTADVLDRSLVSPPIRQTVVPRFRDISAEIGLDHAYEIAATPQNRAFAIYQQNGGGIAIIDYDLDGMPDFYLAQGAADSPTFVATKSDQLVRALVSANKSSVLDITTWAGLRESSYTVGVTSGDWNQDGFPDLATSNIGSTVLLINNGDGTFHPRLLEVDTDLTTLRTSLAMGDVNGDAIPDLFVLNYMRGSGIADKPPLNVEGFATKPMTPHDFEPQLDQLWLNQKNGDVSQIKVGRHGIDESYGLGVVLTDFDVDGGNEVFVGNDAKANQLWKYDEESQSWTDIAVVRGCAFGSLGAPTASMGIAVGDFDNSGSIDLHISNFYNESSSLYLSQDGMFRDLNVKFGIDRSSKSVLGFGTQVLDYSNDGWLDLVVGNGHVENLESAGIPFRQKTQLLTNLANEFAISEIDDPSSYWGQLHLSRSIVTVDCNRDGKRDLVVNGLMEPTVLLLNETNTANHWVGFRLVGTRSERDAIGARVEVVADGHRQFFWVTAGDGYLSKNEATICCGLGGATAIGQVVVSWPSGLRQVFMDVSADAYSLLIENAPTAFVER